MDNFRSPGGDYGYGQPEDREKEELRMMCYQFQRDLAQLRE